MLVTNISCTNVISFITRTQIAVVVWALVIGKDKSKVRLYVNLCMWFMYSD